MTAKSGSKQGQPWPDHAREHVASALAAFDEVLSNANEGQRFYKGLLSRLTQLEQTVQDYVFSNSKLERIKSFFLTVTSNFFLTLF